VLRNPDILVRLAIPASFTCTTTTSLGPLPSIPFHTHRLPHMPHRSSGMGSKLDLNSSTSSIFVPGTLPLKDLSFLTPNHSYSLPPPQHSNGYYIASPDTTHHRLVPQLSQRHLNLLSPSPRTSFMSPEPTASLTRLRSNSRLAESDDSGDHHETSSAEDRLTTHRTGFSDIFS
jgi:hypothetical protein